MNLTLIETPKTGFRVWRPIQVKFQLCSGTGFSLHRSPYSVSVEAGLNLTLSETPKTGFHVNLVSAV